MKAQKTSNGTQTFFEKNKYNSSSRITPYKDNGLSIPSEGGELQIKFQTCQPVTKNEAIVFSPRIDLMNPIYSRQRRKSEDDKNPKSISRSNSVKMTSLNKNEVSQLPSDIREGKIDEAKTKLAQGYYSRYEVYAKVAEKMIDILI